MSAAFYNKMAITAGKLLTKFGSTVTITRTTGRTDDPVTGAVVSGTTTTYSPKGILQTYRDDLVDGSRILSGDRLVVLDDTIEPLTSDKLTINAELWNVVSITQSIPATIALVYFVQVRK